MMRRGSGCLAAVLAGLMFAAPAPWQRAGAQRIPGEIPNPGTYEGSVELQRRQREEERQRQPVTPAPDALRAPASGTSPAAAQAAAQAAYAAWDKRPALPADRNPLLGRWTWQPMDAGGRGMSGMFDGSMANAMGCGVLFGDGAVEFRADAIFNIQQGRASKVGTVAYRGGGQQIVALQRDGQRMFLMFDFVTPDRISLSGVPCVMQRVGAASAPAAASAAIASSAPVHSAAAAPGGFEVLGVTLGRSTEREVRQNIAARGARPLIGGAPGSQELRIEVHDRKYGHPLLANVWYDFNDGVLSAVTIIWERDRGSGPALFRERAEFLAKLLGLGPPSQPARLAGRARGADVVLIDDASAGLVSESYAMPR